MLRWVKISFIAIVVVSLNITCNRQKVLHFEETKLKNKLIADKLLEQPDFDINHKVFDVKFITLDYCSELRNIDEVQILDSQMYVFDKPQNILFVFDMKGKCLRKITHVNSFCTIRGSYFTYNYHLGEISEYTSHNKLANKINTGFLGLEMVSRDAKEFYFSTGGMSGSVHGSSKYELLLTDNKFNFKSFMSSIPEDHIGINYSTGSRFKSTLDGIFYLPLFTDKVYTLDGEKAKLKFRFDFGRQSLTDSIFSVIKNSQDFHNFPYVIDLTLLAYTRDYSIYSFSYQGRLGYILVNNIKKRVEKYGFNFTASYQTHFQDLAPIGSYNDSFISVVKGKKKLYSKEQSLNTKGLKAKSERSAFKTSVTGFVVVFYKLR